jgi:hypothetical protein
MEAKMKFSFALLCLYMVQHKDGSFVHTPSGLVNEVV